MFAPTCVFKFWLMFGDLDFDLLGPTVGSVVSVVDERLKEGFFDANIVVAGALAVMSMPCLVADECIVGILDVAVDEAIGTTGGTDAVCLSVFKSLADSLEVQLFSCSSDSTSIP